MIRRGRSNTTLTRILFFSAITALWTSASAVLAAPAPAETATRIVTFVSNGSTTQHATSAKTVGDFLRERGLVTGAADFISPRPDTALENSTLIEYRAAVPVTLITGNSKRAMMTAATDVGALLEEQGIWLRGRDEVYPSLAELIVANQTIKVVRVSAWTSIVHQKISEKVIHRIDFSLAPGATRILSRGMNGLRETMVRYTSRDNGRPEKTIIATRILRHPRARVIARGISEYAAFANVALRGLQQTSYIAASAVTMVATAYTADCYGCSGRTALGYRAGHGVVAVDPRIIPLGTRLYIPGYGMAVAGDTGGAIIGRRIDLGFNSIGDALLFGRRPVRVFRLH
ncbi:MAG: 3D domain-containing protein [Candidatus Eremiobacteraeota bacterium]|nr:3D domain-containing protein [Candidatus Eremiobacteraeota bacterium]